MQRLQLTFAILKPNVLKNPVALKSIQRIILRAKFCVVRSKRHQFTAHDAEIFYKEHENKFFYQRLIMFMQSGESDLLILAREDAVKMWRNLMGPTRASRALYEAPHTIRGSFGLSDTRNATHGSDSHESAVREIAVFFPNFNPEKWYQEDEPYYRRNQIIFRRHEFVHVIDKDILPSSFSSSPTIQRTT